ncbi:uncharacterized protein LOC108704736 isoform X4 [Xenopus laevis]|uniref:Uncharacterized protein LOC108704736 isoform X4 n=1 Tax=Xenopus laevis TaxID=8355 RepID=A0A8J1LTR0_XENLA|nr:uncharacterized protein LOC108704736 isoform X4 [Xenopus laevis]
MKVKGTRQNNMEQTSILFLLVFFLLQTGAALELTVPSSHQATLGTNAVIPCTFQVDTPAVDIRDVAIFWYFQDKEILNSTSTVGTSNPRLSINKGAIKDGVASLSISNIEISDGGLYRCSVLYSPDRKYKEVRLDIQAPPRITVTNNIVIKDKKSALRASITGFYPVDIEIKWLREGEILAGGTVITPQRNEDGTYRVNSTLTIVPTEENQNFSIRVQHKSLTVPLQEDFQLIYGALPSAAISYKPFKLNVKQILTCRVWGFYPESIAVNWFVNGTRVESATFRRVNSSAVESQFKFLPKAENRVAELSCEVQHKTLMDPLLHKLLVQIPDLTVKHRWAVYIAAIVPLLIAGVIFIVLHHIIQNMKEQPKVREMVCSDNGVFSLDADNFSPKEITISWEVSQPVGSARYQPLVSSLVMSANQDGSFNTTSTCEHLRDKVNGNEAFSLRATVQHAKLKQPVYKEWNSDNEEYQKYFLLRPVMGEISKPIVYHNKETALHCHISHFFPIDLTVTWYKKEKERQELTPISPCDMYKIPEISPHKQEDKTFTCTASLLFSPSLNQDNGTEFICRVEHPSLEGAIEKSTGPIHVKAKPQVIQPINLSISDSGEVLCSLFVLSFYPKEIPITWICGSSQSQETKPSEEKYKENDDGTNDMESTCTIPGNLFNDPEFQMKVNWKHESMDEEESREMSLRNPDFPWRPTIEEISQFIWIQDQATALYCKISPYFPDALTVSWMEKRKGRNPQPVSTYGNYQISAMKPERRNDKTYSYTTQLSLPPSSRVEEDLEFICRVEHPSLERPIERSTGTPQFKAAPKQPNPVQWSVCDKGGALCTLSLHNFYPKTIEVTWICLTGSQKQERLLSEPQYQPNADQTFNVTSSCSVAENLLQLPDCKIRVTWNHPATETSGSREIRPTDPDFPWRPQGSLKPIATLTLGREVTLQWEISDYFPNALTLTWLLRKVAHEEQILPTHKHNYRMENKPRKTPRGTYISTEYLHFIPSILSHQGAEIVCRVAHPSLAQPIDIGTGALHITVAPGDPEPVRLSISDSGKEIMFSLIVTRFYPKHIHIDWTRTSSNIHHQEIIPSHKVIQVNDDETFNAVSDVTIPSHDFTFPLTVTWNHKSTGHTGKRDIHPKDFPWRPVMSEILTTDMYVGTEAEIHCNISGYFPDKLTVTWYKKKENGREELVNNGGRYQIPDIQSQYQPDQTLTCTARLLFSPSLTEEHGTQFICRVKHPSLGEEIERRTGTLYVRAAPKQPNPVQWSVCDKGGALCTLSLHNFYPKPIEVTWICLTGSQKQERLLSEPQYQPNIDQTFNVTSSCSVAENLLQLPDCKIRVIWNHPATETSESREISPTDPDFPWRPQVSLKPIGTLTLGREVTLQWEISDYFPNALTLTWLLRKVAHEEQILPTHKHNYRMENKPRKTPRGTYISTEYLHFIPSILSHQGAEIVCRVAHPSLAQPIDIGTGALHITVAPGDPEPVRLSISDSGKEIMFSLIVTRFYPKDIHIDWTRTSSNIHHQEIIPSHKVIQVNDDETFNAVSDVTIPSHDFTFPLTVTWNHKSTGHTGKRDIYPKDFPWRPVMSEILTTDMYVGTEAEILCNISGYFPDKLTVTWYKKKENGREELVNNGGRYQIPDIQSQYQPDWTLTCTARLLFSPSLTEEHGAQFICRVKHPSLGEEIERRTGTLYVRAAPKQPNPVQWSVCDKGGALCTLSLHNFYPKPIEVTWICLTGSQKQESLLSEPQYQPNTDQTFSVTSSCSVAENLLQLPDCKIRVTWNHPATETSESREMSPTDPDFPWRPQVSLKPIATLTLGREVTLQWEISDYFPNALTLTWLLRKVAHEEQILPTHKHNYRMENKPRKTPRGTYISTEYLHFIPSILSHQGAEIVCRVAHPSLAQPIDIGTGALHITVAPGDPEPVRLSISDSGKEIMFSLIVTRFYPKDIHIDWTRTSSNIHHQEIIPSHKVIQVNDDETINAVSDVTIPSHDFTFPLTVTWNHKSTGHTGKRDIHPKDFPWRPVMSEILTTDMYVGTETEIQCNISGYFPDKLTVTWYKKKENDREELVNNGGRYQIPDIQSQYQPDQTLTCTARLFFSPSLTEEHGAQFICRVKHPSLGEEIERSTGTLYVRAAPKQPNPVQWSVCDKGGALCTLSLHNFYPKPIEVTWICLTGSQKQESLLSEPQYQPNADQTFSVTSSCSVAENLLQLPDCKIRVTWNHPATETSESREMSPTDPGDKTCSNEPTDETDKNATSEDN